MTDVKNNNTNEQTHDAKKPEKPPKYEAPKLQKFERLEKIVLSGEQLTHMAEIHPKLLAARELQLAKSEVFPAYFHGLTMLPLLQEADEVIVEPVDWNDIQSGDIITYRYKDKFPTRRVIFIDRDNDILTIKGDSLPLSEVYLVSRDKVLGRAAARKRDGQWITEKSVTWVSIKWWMLLRNYAYAVGKRLTHAVRWRVRRLTKHRKQYFDSRIRLR